MRITKITHILLIGLITCVLVLSASTSILYAAVFNEDLGHGQLRIMNTVVILLMEK
jgi:hypothetical protein